MNKSSRTLLFESPFLQIFHVSLEALNINGKNVSIHHYQAYFKYIQTYFIFFCVAPLYSLVCFALFCLVKRIIEYFAKEWSEQKVSITDVVGLYSTYQKYIMIGAPNSYQFREKWTWVFYQKNLQKSKHFFYEK